MTIIPNVETFNWKIGQFSSFLPADNYEVFGFTVRNRTPGLGLPLIAVINQSVDAPNGGALPMTALLRLNGGLKELDSGKATAALEFYSAYDQSEVTINGRTVPLETDSTAPLAYRLNRSDVWNIGLRRFVTGGRIDNSLLLIQPYEPGRIPVVFVHGTASSPVWWAEMLNTLRSDPVIRNRFQFWFFQYNSSQAILLSAAELREALTDMVKTLDPQGKDPALRQMVVVGHSQGGLLTKMSAAAPGRPDLEVDQRPGYRRTGHGRGDQGAGPPHVLLRAAPGGEAGRVHRHPPPGELPDEGLGAKPGQEDREHPG